MSSKVTINPDMAKRVKKIISQAGYKALNSTAGTIRNELVRDVAKANRMKFGVLKERVTLVKATSSNLQSRLLFGGDEIGLPLSGFRPRKVKVQSVRGARYGVTVEVDGLRRFIPDVFLAKMPNGKRGVFRRTGPNRLPISVARATRRASDLFAEVDFEKTYLKRTEKLLSQNYKRFFDDLK